MRLEGWRRVRSLWPSFETVACKSVTRSQDEVGMFLAVSLAARSSPLHRRRGGADLADGRLHLELEQGLAALGGGAARIAVEAGGFERERKLRQAIEIDAARMDRHELRGVGDAGMLADRRKRLALPFQELGLGLAGGEIVVVDADHPHTLAGPFAAEPRRHFGLWSRTAAVISDEADGLETRGLEAARNAFEHAGEDRVGHAERARETQVAGRR